MCTVKTKQFYIIPVIMPLKCNESAESVAVTHAKTHSANLHP